jgi:predicted dehydrogenase
MRELFRLTFASWAKGEQSPVTAREARRNLQLVQAAYESARRGQPVAIEPNDREADR